MKQIPVLILAMFLLAVPALALVTNDKVDSAGDAILYLKALDEKADKTKYLLYYAENFLQQDKYRDAQQLARYVLKSLDPKSVEAREILKQAQQAIAESGIPQVNPVDVKF